MKSILFKIMVGATVALIIPVLGNQFVEGWNWSWHDFMFAWVFWVVTASTVYIVALRFKKYKLVVGCLVFLVFAGIWGMLATG
jgi:hypothetical protein